MADDILTRKIEYPNTRPEDTQAEPLRALEEGPGVRPRYFVDISTHENVTIKYESAGLGSRFTAAVVDTLIRAVFWIMVAVAVYFIFFHGRVSIDLDFDIFEGIEYLASTALVVYFGILLSRLIYFEIFESVWSGYTPGKKLLGIRAVSVTGEAASFSQITVRTVMRFLHMIPGGEFADGVAALLSAKKQRLGDMAAGTMVIKVGRVKNASEVLARKIAADAKLAGNGDAGDDDAGGDLDGFGRVSDRKISDFLAEMHAMTEKARASDNVTPEGSVGAENGGDLIENAGKYMENAGKYAENGGKHDNSVEDPFAGAEDVEREQAEKRRNSYVPEGGYLTYYETRVLLTYLENRARLPSPVTYDRKFAEFIFEKSGQQRPKKLNRNKTFSFIREVARYHAWLHGILGGVRV